MDLLERPTYFERLLERFEDVTKEAIFWLSSLVPQEEEERSNNLVVPEEVQDEKSQVIIGDIGNFLTGLEDGRCALDFDLAVMRDYSRGFHWGTSHCYSCETDPALFALRRSLLNNPAIETANLSELEERFSVPAMKDTSLKLV